MSHKVRPITEKIRINLDEYVNKETGEKMSSELKGGVFVTARKPTDRVEVHSDDFVTIDSKIMGFLYWHLNRQEIGAISMMVVDLNTSLNLVYNGDVPHTNETLRKALGMESRSTFALLMQKLIRLGVLHKVRGRIQGEVRMVYIMNPFLARKRKTVDGQIVRLFDKFKDPGKPGQFPNDVQ